MIDDALCCEDYDAHVMDDQRQRILMEDDDNEDFLVEGNLMEELNFFNLIAI